MGGVVTHAYAGGWQAAGFRCGLGLGWRLEYGDGAEDGFNHGEGDSAGAIDDAGGWVEDGRLQADGSGATVQDGVDAEGRGLRGRGQRWWGWCGRRGWRWGSNGDG